MVMACIYALLLWFHWVKVIPAARAVVGCRHTSGTMEVGVRHERTGKPTAMYWVCNGCGLQMHFPRLMRLPNGTWWLLDEEEVRPYEHPDDPPEGQGGQGGVRPEA